jgi:hypothetical protein
MALPMAVLPKYSGSTRSAASIWSAKAGLEASLLGAGPEHDRDGHTLDIGLDRGDDHGITERGREAPALQVEFATVDADRHVDRKHELDVDRLAACGVCRAGRHANNMVPQVNPRLPDRGSVGSDGGLSSIPVRCGSRCGQAGEQPVETSVDFL